MSDSILVQGIHSVSLEITGWCGGRSMIPCVQAVKEAELFCSPLRRVIRSAPRAPSRVGFPRSSHSSVVECTLTSTALTIRIIKLVISFLPKVYK